MVEKRVKKFGQALPPPFRAMPERNRFFLWEVFPYTNSFKIFQSTFMTCFVCSIEYMQISYL